MCRQCGIMWIVGTLVVIGVLLAPHVRPMAQPGADAYAGTPDGRVSLRNDDARYWHDPLDGDDSTDLLPSPPRMNAIAQDAERRDRPPRLDRPAADIITIENVVYATIELPDGEPIELRFDAAFPAVSDGQPLPAVVYIHGGGFRTGRKEDGRVFTATLARRGYFAASIEYRLSDAAPFPAAVHDCKAAIRFLRANADELVIDADRIGVWGHSAGGHLAAYLALTGNREETHGAVGTTGVSSAVHCAVPISGIFDFAAVDAIRTGRTLRSWLGSMTGEAWEQRLREASPITWVDSHAPPMLLIHGTDDRVVPHEQSRVLTAALKQANASVELIELPGAGHIIRDRSAYEQAMAFFDRHLREQAQSRDPAEIEPETAF